MSLSLFSSPVCAACASPACPGALALASCPVVAVASAALVAAAPVGVALPVVVPVERAVLAAVAVRLAHEADAPLASCPACGRRVPCGVAALAFLALAPRRLAPGRLGRRGLWCPICGRLVLVSQSPKLAVKLRRWLAGS